MGGDVLPVGGIRDKVLAAHRAGLTHVLLPLANKRNVLEDVPAEVLHGLEIHYLKHVDSAFEFTFGPELAAKLKRYEPKPAHLLDISSDAQTPVVSSSTQFSAARLRSRL